MVQNHPYVFISYAHKDSDVLPCIEEMKKSGINLWYDDGIEAGSEWPEFIAQKVVECDKFVLFVSNAYLNSQNCRRELNFAISRKKEILSVFIEEVSLSPGMEMQLGSYQAIYLNRFSSKAHFYSSLCSEPFFDSCRLKAPEKENVPKVETKPSAKTKPPQKVKTNEKSGTNKTFAQRYIKSCATTPKSRILAAALAFVLGYFGVHKFYLGQWLLGILYLALFIIGCATLSFVILIPGVCPFIEIAMLLLMKDEKLKKIYGCDFKWA